MWYANTHLGGWIVGVDVCHPTAATCSYWYVWEFGHGELHAWPQTDEMKDLSRNLGHGASRNCPEATLGFGLSTFRKPSSSSSSSFSLPSLSLSLSLCLSIWFQCEIRESATNVHAARVSFFLPARFGSVRFSSRAARQFRSQFPIGVFYGGLNGTGRFAIKRHEIWNAPRCRALAIIPGRGKPRVAFPRRFHRAHRWHCPKSTRLFIRFVTRIRYRNTRQILRIKAPAERSEQVLESRRASTSRSLVKLASVSEIVK